MTTNSVPIDDGPLRDVLWRHYWILVCRYGIASIAEDQLKTS